MVLGPLLVMWLEFVVAIIMLGPERYWIPFQSFLIAPKPALKQARSMRSAHAPSPVACSR
jgi:hypothetical protein